jgi:uncharacterized protein (TIGR03382 family)
LHIRAAVALAALLSLPGAARAASVWTALATEKIRPSAAPRATTTARIAAARNEFEAFQVVVAGPATNVRAAASTLDGPGRIDDVQLYRAALIQVSTPSALDGDTGAWPDALVPDMDEVEGERRNAFPFDVPAGEYAGEVSVSWDGGGASVPVSLEVWPFTLPASASLKTAFGFTWSALRVAHGVDGDAFSALRARYGELALDHRLTLSKIDDGNRDLDHFAAFFGPQLDGASHTRLAGAASTTIEFLGQSADATRWSSFFDARGWRDRLYQYTCDEPPLTCAWSDIPARARAAREASPPFRTLVTTSIQDADAHGVTASIDILVPVVNYLDDRPGTAHAGEQRGKYDAFLATAEGREVWTYQSCMSHGCGGTVDMGSPSEQDRYFTGWPSYMIDASAVRNRAMEWLSFRYRVTGELYYETALAFGRDAWRDQWDFSGNGDGTLFYPGTPAEIGGTTHVPVASIRLKMLREGMEDYEYLRRLSDAGDPTLAHAIADALFPHAYETEVAPERLMEARERIARRIVELEGGKPDPPPRDPATSPGRVMANAAGGCAAGRGGTSLLALAGLVVWAALRRRRAHSA